MGGTLFNSRNWYTFTFPLTGDPFLLNRGKEKRFHISDQKVQVQFPEAFLRRDRGSADSSVSVGKVRVDHRRL